MHRAIVVGTRGIVRRPIVATISALSLGIGIAAAAVAWVLLDAGVRRPFRLHAADHLLVIWETDPAQNHPLIEVSYLNFVDWQRQTRTVESLAAFGSQHWPGLGRIGGEAVPLALRGVSTTFFPTLRVTPIAGRNFHVHDALPEADAPIVLSSRLWQTRFAGRSDIVGQRIFIDGIDHLVIGVMPPAFAYPDDPDAWVSVERVLGEAFQKMPVNQQRMVGVLQVLARRRPATTNAQVQEELTGIIQALQGEHGATTTTLTTVAAVTPFSEVVLGQLGARLWIAVGMSVMAFLLACANVGAVRAAQLRERETEIAARSFLGASRRRLVRDLAVESVPLTVMGLCAAVILSLLLLRLLGSTTVISDSGIDLNDYHTATALWLLALAVASAVLTGVLPGYVAAGRRLFTVQSTSTRALRRISRVTSPLLMGQAATVTVVVALATVALQTFARLSAVDMGFSTRGVTFVDLAWPGWKYDNAASVRQITERLQTDLQSLPGVTHAAGVSVRPLRFGEIVDGQPVRRTGDVNVQPHDAVGASRVVVTPEYFGALQQPIVAGRGFTTADRADNEPVAVITRTLARTLFGDERVVGRSIDTFSLSEKWSSRRIVGIAGDARYRGLGRPSLEVFVPHVQAATPLGSLVVASRTPIQASVMRELLARVDPDIAIERLQTTSELRQAVLSPARLLATTVSLLGAAGLMLLIIGLVGATATALRSAWSEIGVRQAIGAKPLQAARAPLRVAMRAVLLGLCGGAALAPVVLGAARALGLDANGFVVPLLVATTVVPLAVTLGVVPELLRAARVSPAELLRRD